MQRDELRRGGDVVRPRAGQGDGHGLLDAAGRVAHDRHPVGQVDRLLHVVGDEQHGQPVPLPHPGQQLLHVVPGQGVEGAERLVHQQHLRPVGQRPGDRHALLHAARKLVRIGVGEAVEADQRQMLARPLAQLRSPVAGGAQRELDVPLRRQPGQQRVALEDDAAVAPGPQDRLAVDQHRPGVEVLQPGRDRQQRALAAAGGADQRHELVLGQRQVHVFEGDDALRIAPEHLAQPGDLQLRDGRRRAHGRASA